MLLNRLAAVKGGGRKTLFSRDNLYSFIFLVMIITLALLINYGVFAYFTLGVFVMRIFEVIFELKGNILDKSFLAYVLGIGIPAQFLWTLYH